MAQECEWVLETMKSTFGLKIDPSWVKINRCSLHFLDKELTFLIATHSLSLQIYSYNDIPNKN